MSYIDILIPLGLGLVLALSPQSFTKKVTAENERIRRTTYLRRIGYVLVAVAALYAGIKALGA